LECDDGSIEMARAIFERAEQALKQRGSKEERSLLIDAWLQTEQENGGGNDQIGLVEEKKPKVVKKRRLGEGGVWEEYYDYIFADDEGDSKGFKLLAMAQKWKVCDRTF
jgi:crooked neck